MKATIFLIALITLISCSSKQEISIEDETRIFENVLPEILDSIHLNVLPPPQNDSIANIYRNGKMLIILKDSTESLDKDDQIAFRKNYKGISMNIDSSDHKKLRNGLCEIKNVRGHKLGVKLKSNKFDFKLASETQLNNLTKVSSFCGQLGLSNIKLDDSNEYGLFSISYRCCSNGNCGIGYRVYLKKMNSKWVVDKIIPTWQS